MSRLLSPALSRMFVSGGSSSALVLPRLLPLWRHVVWAILLFTVAGFAVHEGVGVRQSRTDLARTTRAVHEAGVLNQRLQLELDARRRLLRMEEAGSHLDMNHRVPVIRLESSK